MLEFDVATQLFPNVLTVVTQLAATFIIFIFAKKFLWNIARDTMEARKEKMQKGLIEAENKNLEAQKLVDESKENLEKAKTKSEMIVNNAKKEAEEVKDEIINNAKVEAESIITKANQRIEKEREEMLRDINKEIVDVAMAASSKLLEDKDLSDLDANSIDNFVKEINEKRAN